jgi:FtsZ-interacting cell division protein ZipA
MIAGLSTRIIAMIVGAVLLLGIIAFGVHSCDQRRSKAAQSRVERSQAEAAQNSARDAINAVAASNARETASEDLTRSNEKEIRNAQGADAHVGAGVNTAGRNSLCRRAAYRDDPKCRVRKPASR